MTHLYDESGQSRAQQNHSRARRRGAYRSRRRPVVVAALSLIAVVAGGLAANKVASAPSSDASSVTETSLWSADVRPAQPADSDTRSVELGTSFRTSQAGAVTGIRFYKHPENTGRHTGRLWDDRGHLLTSVTFDNEAASGWQAARLASPVALQPGRWYVVSYHAPAGRYAGRPELLPQPDAHQRRAAGPRRRVRLRRRGQVSDADLAECLVLRGRALRARHGADDHTHHAGADHPATHDDSGTDDHGSAACDDHAAPDHHAAPDYAANSDHDGARARRSGLHLAGVPTSDSNGGWSEGGYYVHNNMWNISKYPSLKETLEACSHASWNVTATADDNAQRRGQDVPQRPQGLPGLGAYGEPAWSSFKTMRSTFAAQGPGVGIYNVAYDIWMNGVPGNREIMIWTENHGQRPAGDIVASGVSFSGITWDVWATGDNGYLAFTPKSTLPSGSLDIKAMIDYLVAHGRVPDIVHAGSDVLRRRDRQHRRQAGDVPVHRLLGDELVAGRRPSDGRAAGERVTTTVHLPPGRRLQPRRRSLSRRRARRTPGAARRRRPRPSARR